MATDSFYFKHDRNARNDLKLIKVRRKYKMGGYGVYFALIEILSDQKDYKLPLADVTDIAFELSFPETKLRSIINDFGLFEVTDGFFYSQSLLNKMEDFDKLKNRRAIAGRAGGLARNAANARQKDSNGLAAEDKNGKDKGENKSTVQGPLPLPLAEMDKITFSDKPSLKKLVPIAQLKADVLRDSFFPPAYHEMGIQPDALSDWLDAFNRWLLFCGEKTKNDKDYRSHFGSWLRTLPFTTMKPTEYNPAKDYWERQPKTRQKEVNTGDEKFRIEMEKIRLAKKQTKK